MVIQLAPARLSHAFVLHLSERNICASRTSMYLTHVTAQERPNVCLSLCCGSQGGASGQPRDRPTDLEAGVPVSVGSSPATGHVFSPHLVWGSNYFDVRRPAPAACSSVTQTFWTQRCEVINCALAQDVFISANLTMSCLGGQVAFSLARGVAKRTGRSPGFY